MAVPNVQTARLTASLALRDRLFVAVTAASAPDAAAVVSGQGFGGLIVVDQRCGRRVRTLKAAYGARVLIGKDTESYLRYKATAAQPMNLLPILGGAAPSLNTCMRDQLSDGADFALTPTGLIKDLDTLNAAVAEANALARVDVVLAVPISDRALVGMDRVALSAALERSRLPIALIVTGQFDPYKDTDVATRVRCLLTEHVHVFLHRTDFAAFESLAHGGLSGSIGYTASLRHTVPGRRQPRTRKEPPDNSPIVLLPEIDSFRHRAVFERWYRSTRPPICNLPGCCGQNLALLRTTEADREVANRHNLQAWLPLGQQLAIQPQTGRRHWLHTYRQQVETAYVDLRRRTKVREIAMDDSQKVWLTLGP